MIIRRLTPSDLDEHNKTSSSAFIWGITDQDNTLPESLMYGAFTDDNKTGMAQMECADFKVFFGTSILGCAGIGGVATRPEYRSKGCIKAIFDLMAQQAAENGFDISILYPFSTGFYEKLGYANLGYKTSLRTEPSNFSQIEKNTSVILYENDNCDKLYELYNSFAKQTDLMFERNNNRYFFTQPYKNNKYTYIYVNSDGQYRAYVSFSVNREQSSLYVSEIGYLDIEALKGIIGFLRVYEGNINHIEFQKLPLNSPIFSLLNDTSHIERRLIDLGSARIHNIRKVLESRSYPMEKGSFSFYADDIFEDNRGIYDVAFGNNSVSLTVRQYGEYDISLDCRAMARIFLCGNADNFEKMSFRKGIKINKRNPDFLKAFPVNDVFFFNGF